MTRLTDQALADLTALADYVGAEDGDRARAFVKRVVERCFSLASAPLQGRPRPELGPHVRSISVDYVVVFYRVRDDGRSVEVVRAIDGRRDLRTISLAAWSAQPVTGVLREVRGGPLPQLKNDPFFE